MKMIIYLLMSALIVISCKGELDDELFVLPSNSESRAIAVHPVYNALGWGYDITGSHMSYKSVKSPVIDINKFDAENSNDITVNNPYQRTEKVYYASNAVEYIKK